jgi:SAM-dependent methyltransferase
MGDKSPEPRSARLLRVGDDIYRSRHDLQRVFAHPSGPEFWYWLLWHGIEEYPELRAYVYQLPETFLRDRVVGEGVDDQAFHRGGLVDWRRLEQCLRGGGYEFSGQGRILDFGCGCARTLRFFTLYQSTTALYGGDVDREAIDWCTRCIDAAAFTCLEHEPPMPYPDGMFNGVTSFSVFTHLSESHHLAWLKDLLRVTVPGAVLVLTTQGQEVMRRILAGECESQFPPTAVLRPALERIQSTGFGFFPYRTLQPSDDKNRNAFAQWNLNAYGSTFILETYVRSRWSQFFDVVSYLPAPDGWQDFVTLRRR